MYGVNVDQSEGSLRTDRTGQRSGVICDVPINGVVGGGGRRLGDIPVTARGKVSPEILQGRGQQGLTKVNFTVGVTLRFNTVYYDICAVAPKRSNEPLGINRKRQTYHNVTWVKISILKY